MVITLFVVKLRCFLYVIALLHVSAILIKCHSHCTFIKAAHCLQGLQMSPT